MAGDVGLAAGREGLDDEHAAAAARARERERLRRIGLACLLGRRWGQVQELACRRDGLGAIAAAAGLPEMAAVGPHASPTSCCPCAYELPQLGQVVASFRFRPLSGKAAVQPPKITAIPRHFFSP